jgi:nitrate/nitrite transporter NarK
LAGRRKLSAYAFQLVGVPLSLLFGMLADRIGAERAIFVTLALYATISVYDRRPVPGRTVSTTTSATGTSRTSSSYGS